VVASASSLRVLGPREAALLAAERSLLGELREALASLDAAPQHLAAVRQAAADLDDLFLLVVVGEFNAGKSALLNALLGGPYLEEGVTPTTADVTIIRHGAHAGSRPGGDGTVERTVTAPLLQEISIVDTPGTNAIVRRHEELTREFVPRSDLVLFVTSVDRPFAESERAFMEHIRTWGKKVVIILNKVDLLQDEAQLDEVRGFVRESVNTLLGFAPEVFPVSARLALQAKTATLDAQQRNDLWERSRFEALERYLSQTLDEAERVRLKLLNPLGVAERIAARESERTRERLAVLRDDLKGAEAIEGQLDLYRTDLRRDFGRRLHEVDNVVHELNDRADAFFDDTLRFGRVFDLFNADRLRTEFERRVIADSARRIDDAVQSLVDWLLDQEQHLWRSVAEYVGRRTESGTGMGKASLTVDALQPEGWSFAQERRRMLTSVERAADQALSHYDPEAEARRWSLSMREAVTQTALTEVGALGLGAAVMALIGTTAADVTGVLAASIMAGLGLYIIPLRRRQARQQFHQKTETLRTRLEEGLSRQFEAELERSIQRIRAVLAPYSRRIRAEYDRLNASSERLTGVQRRLTDLRTRAERELPAAAGSRATPA
jgi:small GTP-binding protein